MDGKVKKSGTKRGSKIVEVGIDSDDDEPIGSLFKLMKHKIPKKSKVETESHGERGQREAVKEKKSSTAYGDSEDMDDTLANFRKRLKGHKKVAGSGFVRERCSVFNSPMLVDSNSNLKSTSEALEEGQDMGDGGSDAETDSAVENKYRIKVKKPEIVAATGSNVDWSGSNGESRCLKSEAVILGDKNKEAVSLRECSNHSSAEDISNHIKESMLESESRPCGNKPCPRNEEILSQHDIVERCSALLDRKQINSLHGVLINESKRASLKGVLDQHSEGCATMSNAHAGVCSSSAKKETAVVGSGDDNLLVHVEGPDPVSVSSQTENFVMCDCSIQVNLEDGSLEAKERVNMCQKCRYSLCQEASKGNGVRAHDDPTFKDKNTEPSPVSVTADGNESLHGDAVSLPDSELKTAKPSAVHRPERNARKRRLGDMAYEGDFVWEILSNEQGFLESQSDKSLKGSEKFASSNILKQAEIGRAAAIMAGLKARSVSPIEKILFKEVLKRRASHQEYLDCRNSILGLWSKNLSRILPFIECGVSSEPSEDELPRASLIREIYNFLDQRGYINFGIASVRGKEEPSGNHDFHLHEKKLEERSMASVADSEDGVAFILGQVKGTVSTMEGKKDVPYDDENQEMGSAKIVGVAPPAALASTSRMQCKAISSGDCKPPASEDALQVDGSAVYKDGKEPVVTSMMKLPSTESSTYEQMGGKDCSQCDLKDEKKIIVIGAGPAGLIAARHLQRQGFSVTVLEARNRVGGRVYTDRSSLSVPVDLGASIITGIEADVASERMPDPSALVCNQLGLELSVLHGFCPLYDIVTGQKVPSDLDDALQAEFNTLIDEVDLLVEEIGKEQANRTSLEDGLEYGLRRLRIPHDKIDIERLQLGNIVDPSCLETGSFSGSFTQEENSRNDILNPLERRVMNWHFAHTEYGCAAVLKEVSLPNWNQDEYYGGFGGPHAMIKGGYSKVVESLSEGLDIRLNSVVTEILYASNISMVDDGKHKVRVCTANGAEFAGNAVLITVPLGCLKAETIKFSPPLPDWKYSSIKRLGFGVLNKVILEFPEVFWDDSVDYFGATAEKTDQRGECFMFWNVKKTVGAPVLIALVVGKAAVDFQKKSKSEHVSHAMMVLRKLFGGASVPDPVASVVTDWGTDPYSYGAYSYVGIGASGEDYDTLGRPVENCLFFAGEATCKEHPDTVGGAMISGLREAVRIIDIFRSGNDYTAEVEALEVAHRETLSVSDEVGDLMKRLEVVELSNVLARQSLLRNMFFSAKTTIGRLHVAKELLNLPIEALKSFAGTKEGLTTLNSWILDSMGKNGTQLLRHCVHILVRISSDLLAVRVSGIGKTVKEKVCAHTSRDIRAIASQLVSVWLELFRKEKANGRLRTLRQINAANHSRQKVRLNSGDSESTGGPSNGKEVKMEGDVEDHQLPMSEEEKAAFAAAEAARAAAEAAAKAFSEAYHNTSLQLPKIPSFHKFARREQYAKMDEADFRKKFPGSVLGRQDCLSEIDSRNCKVRDWYDFPAACLDIDNARMPVDNHSQRSHSNDIVSHPKFREQSGESAAADSSIFTRAWVDTGGISDGLKDYQAIDRWQSQAAAADPDFFNRALHIKDEEDSNASSSRLPNWKHDKRANESSVSQVTVNKEPHRSHPRGADRLKQAVVDYVASLLMPLYKSRKIDRDGYKSIMKKTATKVMEQATDVEKAMSVSQFLDYKRKNKIRAFVDKLIERHMAMTQAPKL